GLGGVTAQELPAKERHRDRPEPAGQSQDAFALPRAAGDRGKRVGKCAEIVETPRDLARPSHLVLRSARGYALPYVSCNFSSIPDGLENPHTSPYILFVRIALISTPFFPVPPPKYGGTELIVYHLARDLAARGHHVILYSTGSSRLPGVECRSLYPEAIWPPDPWHELNHAAFAMRDIVASEPVDVIHAHVAPTLALAPFTSIPVRYTVHHVREQSLQAFYGENQHPNVHFVAISERQQQLLLPEVTSTVVHHGLDVDAYPLGRGGGYAAFLGRFAVEKGPATAIDVAQ